MPSNRRKALMIATLGIAFLANLSLIPSSHAGPISDMLARRRMNKQMKIPPMDMPFSKTPIRDPNLRTASLSERFKKRFSLGRGNSDGTVPMTRGLGIFNTAK